VAERHDIPVTGGTAHVVFTDSDDGDFRILDPVPDLELRRRQLVDAPWNWIRQVHGNGIRIVTRAGEVAGEEADGLITTAFDCPVAVTTADCAPVVLVAERGLAVLHVGWRGLVAGIVEQGGETLRRLGGEPVTTLLGPCIHPDRYEFGPRELSSVAERYGPDVVSRTETGTPALDMPAAVGLACRSAGWPRPEPGSCTSDDRFFSHRIRADQARLATVAWLRSAAGGGEMGRMASGLTEGASS
jgi:copper oxidase (laccase) domain-containing protein